MSKRTLRKIIVKDRTYLWNRRHTHLQSYEYSPCVEILTVYRDGNKKCPLRLFFREEDSIKNKKSPKDLHWFVGYPEDGVIWKTYKGDKYVNLNRPGVVAAIIKFAIDRGWHSDDTNKPMEIYNAFEWLDLIDFPKPREN